MSTTVWYALGIGVAVIEWIAPTGVLIIFGVAAGVVGFVDDHIHPMTGEEQFLLFFAATIVAALVNFSRYPYPRRHAAMTRYKQYRQMPDPIGSEGVMTTPMRDGHGAVRLNATIWPAVGPHMPAGTHVRVVAHDGAILRVEPVLPPAVSSRPASTVARTTVCS
ncbi:MAG: NfeD family protein [Alphaproteobacteria bacterium]|nr:NfeD family protein [Alphaproteobacteria bacterium]